MTVKRPHRGGLSQPHAGATSARVTARSRAKTREDHTRVFSPWHNREDTVQAGREMHYDALCHLFLHTKVCSCNREHGLCLLAWSQDARHPSLYTSGLSLARCALRELRISVAPLAKTRNMHRICPQRTPTLQVLGPLCTRASRKPPSEATLLFAALARSQLNHQEPLSQLGLCIFGTLKRPNNARLWHSRRSPNPDDRWNHGLLEATAQRS